MRVPTSTGTSLPALRDSHAHSGSAKTSATPIANAQTPPLVGAKISDPDSNSSSIPNYAKHTAATSPHRMQSFRNRTACRNRQLLLPSAPSRPTPPRIRPNPPSLTESCPPDADARQIGSLWGRVMADKRSGTLRTAQASQAKKKLPMGKDSGIGISASSRYRTRALPTQAPHRQ